MKRVGGAGQRRQRAHDVAEERNLARGDSGDGKNRGDALL